MKTILIVDDRPINREYLMTLLGYRPEFRLLEARGGAEALQVARTGPLDLVITDILMPNMDGYEFVHQLRADSMLQHIPVVFCTAHYLEREALALAHSCGVAHFLFKPIEPQTVYDIVDAALSMSVIPAMPEAQDSKEFDREHLRLVTDKLADKSDALRAVNQKLNAMIDLNLQLEIEADLKKLLARFCEAARDIIGAKSSVLGILHPEENQLLHFYTTGLSAAEAAQVKPLAPDGGALGRLLAQRHCVRFMELKKQPQHIGLDLRQLPVTSLLGTSIATPQTIYGWLCLLDKIGGSEFSDDDERLANILASQLGRIYENHRLLAEARDYSTALEREIVERLHIGVRLQESETQLTGIIASAMDAIISVDENQRIILFNHAAETIFGCPPATAIGQPLDIFIPKKYHQAHRQHIEKFRQSQVTKRVMNNLGEIYGLRYDGEEFPVEASISQSGLHGKKIFTVILRDISARQKAEKALQLSESRSRQIIESDMMGIIFCNKEETIVDANQEFLNMIGFEREALSAGLLNWERLTPPQFRHLDQQAFHDLAANGKCAPYEKEIYRKDGSRLPILIGGTILENYNDVKIAFVLDISKLKSLEQQLNQAQKMEAVGRLAGGVAHDFNNLLTAIIGYSQIVLLRTDKQDPRRPEIQEVLKAGERAADLTKQLLAFSRHQVLQPRVLNLNQVVSDTEKLLQRILGEDIDIKVSLKADLPNIKADPGQMSQVIINLCVNARDAMPDGGKLILETDTMEVNEAYISAHQQLPPGDYVVLMISDNGCGMDKETISHIFELFFTTKGPDQGTGLGLATVYGIVKQSGGHLWVYSEPNYGTTFKIFLPIIFEGVEIETTSQMSEQELKGSETLLLVEDEEMLRVLACKILETCGYTVLVATNGQEAWEIHQRYSEPIDLLLTDVIMPQMNGRELVAALGIERPTMKIIYMSGYTDNTNIAQDLLKENVKFIQKPFQPENLARLVRQSLNEPQRSAVVH
ncbi:MAG: response regulator [Acidobacteria bacterium]|nr:response regulator [Acidobacteriota bacterium]